MKYNKKYTIGCGCTRWLALTTANLGGRLVRIFRSLGDLLRNFIDESEGQGQEDRGQEG